MCVCVCAPHSAGRFAGVFREAEQQVENGPAMLQHALSRQETQHQPNTVAADYFEINNEFNEELKM